ncbi:MAG TPA: OB-fold domain-containing protein [Gemmataceae bacterium]|jgi:uncharacterized OB-fold protein|nr:OB-fold domain-containing protein [Gemmataceae bacterium]
MSIQQLAINEVPTIGRIGPRPDGVDNDFWSGLAIGELRMQQCADCGEWYFLVWRCGRCGSWDVPWVATPQVGRIYSWIRTYQPFAKEFVDILPYVTVLVELPAAGKRRLLGVLVGDQDGLKIGAEVVGVIQEPSDLTNGKPVLRWELARS